jgi:hypothetical protein
MKYSVKCEEINAYAQSIVENILELDVIIILLSQFLLTGSVSSSHIFKKDSFTDTIKILCAIQSFARE